MSIFRTLNQVIRSGVCNREQSLDQVCASELRQCRRGVKYHSIAGAIPVGVLGQDSLPSSAFADFNPSPISRRMTTVLDGMRLEKRKSPIAASGGLGIAVITRSELGAFIDAKMESSIRCVNGQEAYCRPDRPGSGIRFDHAPPARPMPKHPGKSAQTSSGRAVPKGEVERSGCHLTRRCHPWVRQRTPSGPCRP
jgi:hypothetical protein